MVRHYYKTGAEIYSILRFMKNSLDLPYKPSASSIEVVKMYADKKYRFSFFLNERKEIVYLIEQLGDDMTDCSKEEKPMTNMTKEEALKKIEELKVFVEKLDEEIPEMPYDENGTNQIVIGRHMISFNSLDTRECYRIKAFELAHLMYAREHINHFGITNGPVWHLYFDTDYLDYRLIQPANVRRYSDFTNPWVFINRDDATKVCNYMNRYVKNKVKELY